MENIINKSRLPLFAAIIFIFILFLSFTMLSGFGRSVAAAELLSMKAPSVVSTNPKNRTGGVLLNSKISATFSEAMNPKTFTANFASVKGPGGTEVPGTISFSGANSIFTFTPSNNLATGTRYTVTFKRGVRSSRGVSLSRKYSFSFITIGDFIYSAEGNGKVSSWSVGGGRISSSPASTGTGPDACSVAIDPSGKYLYSANCNDGTLSSYSIDNGVVSSAPLSTTVRDSEFSPHNLTVDPSGGFIYVTNWNNGAVSSYSVSNGVISPNPISTTEAKSGTFNGATTVVVDPSGNYLYVDGGAGNSTGGFNSVTSYSIAGGMLTPLGGASNHPNGSIESAESIVQSGNLLFVAEDHYSYISSYAVSGGIPRYTGNSTPYEPEAGFVYLAVDPSGRYLFASENHPGNIISYSIGANGALTKLSETALGYGQLDNPLYIIVDPSGKYLYVTYYSTGNLAVYSIEDGMLSADPVSEIGRANAMIAGDYTSIAITPSVYKSPEWPVSRLPLVQSVQPNNTNGVIKKIKNNTEPIFNWFNNVLK